MRIGETNQSNYMEYLKLLSKKNNNKSSTQSSGSTNEADIVRKYQLADPEHYGIPGMDITGKNPSDWQRIVDVSDDIRDKITNLARKEFINNYGMSDGEELSALKREYVLSLPENERLSASWTLERIFIDESLRLADIVKSQTPDWQAGQAFDRSILADYISGNNFDIKV